MHVENALGQFIADRHPTNDFLSLLEDDRDLRKDLANHFRHQPDRGLALALLAEMITCRNADAINITTETLMLGCYVLGLHQQVEDSLQVWNAKIADFDTFCGLDIQLALFAGADETITYLTKQDSEEAKKALEYILKCQKADDFDDLASYHDRNELPWYI
jgi:hypothetical protein